MDTNLTHLSCEPRHHEPVPMPVPCPASRRLAPAELLAQAMFVVLAVATVALLVLAYAEP